MKNLEKPTENAKKRSQKTVAAYIRVSTEATDQENSFEAQERYFQRLLEQNPGWVSAGIYADYGISGTDGKKRTGFKRLMRHCQENKIDCIVCKSTTRFARNTADFLTALRVLKEHHVTILFEKEGLDTAETTSDFILTTLGAIAQEESRSISGNVLWGNQKRYPRGDVRNQVLYGYQYNGRILTTASGYRYKDIEIVEEEAAIVRRIFQEVASGATYVEIARKLNREGIAPPGSFYIQNRKEKAKRGQLKSHIDEGWTGSRISRMVRRERYVGDVLMQKTYTLDYLTHKTKLNRGEKTKYITHGHHPAIVDRILYEQTENAVKSTVAGLGNMGGMRKRRGFSGCLICGECGRFYHVRNTKSHPIWFCPSTTLHNGRTICHGQKVYEEQLVRMFRRAMIDRFHLAVVPLGNHVNVDDIFSGCFSMGQVAMPFCPSAVDFVSQMIRRLEDIQRMDQQERDRAFYKRKISELGQEKEAICKQIGWLQKEIEILEGRNCLPREDSGKRQRIYALENEINRCFSRQIACEKEMTKLLERLAHLEEYWEALETVAESREKALAWMQTLPAGHEGTAQFLNGLTGEYVRAFALSISIYSPYCYCIHWFDDSKTDVKMDSNVEDFRRTKVQV